MLNIIKIDSAMAPVVWQIYYWHTVLALATLLAATVGFFTALMGEKL